MQVHLFVKKKMTMQYLCFDELHTIKVFIFRIYIFFQPKHKLFYLDIFVTYNNKI